MWLPSLNARPKTGTAAIEEAIGELESIAGRIEAAVQQDKEQVEGNLRSINILLAENSELDSAASRGQTIAEKLRELIN
jgi:hypothetical protein